MIGFAPYMGISLIDKVILPDWQSKVSHLQAQQEAFDGVIKIKLTAKTAVFCANQQPTQADKADTPLEFSQHPNGKLMLSGSTVRAAIRNVLEIATYGKSMFVDNHVVAVRNFYDENYKKTIKNQKAGWLKFSGDKWTFSACEVETFSYDDQKTLLRLGDYQLQKWVAKDKYNVWPLTMPIMLKEHKGKEWRAVFVGYIAKKTGDYYFRSHSPQSCEDVPAEVVNRFKLAHQNKESHLDDLLKNPCPVNGIPVFAFYNANNKIQELGLAKLPRVAASEGPKDKLDKQRLDNNSNQLDFPELLFGRVFVDSAALKGIEQGLKHRISFSDFTQCSTNAISHRPLAPRTHTLMTPRASYTPYSLEPSRSGHAGSFHDRNSKLRVQHKRYFQRKKLAGVSNGAPRNTQEDNRLVTKFTPLPEGSIFNGTLTFKNLNPIELGAILWALKLDGQTLYHQLGMAKPYGYGSIECALESIECRKLSPEHDPLASAGDLFNRLAPTLWESNNNELVASISAFKRYVADQANANTKNPALDFNALVPIEELLYMLRQHDDSPGYMDLKPDRNLSLSIQTMTYTEGRKHNQGQIPVPIEALQASRSKTKT